MFVEQTWRGQRVVGWQAVPPVPAALVLPGERSTPLFAPVDGRVPDCLPFDGGLLELAAWRAALLAAPAGEVAAVLRSRPERPVDCSPVDWEQVLVDSISARQRAMAFESAQQTRDFIDIAATASEVPNDAREFLGCELGLAMGVADSTASSYVAEAIDLFVRCPATFAALEAGAIVPAKATTIRSHTQDLSHEVTALVEADVLPGAGRSTMPQLRNRIAASIIRRDPVGADTRHEKAKTRRRISARREEDGMASLWLYGTAQDVGTIVECVHALSEAAKTDGDPRRKGERDVDALVDVCGDVLARGVFQDRPLPDQQRRRPQLLVTIPATALLDPASGRERGCGEVADLAGYGPITIAQAAKIAADATWRRLICDPTSGALLDYGRTTYQPPKSLADFVLTRDKTAPSGRFLLRSSLAPSSPPQSCPDPPATRPPLRHRPPPPLPPRQTLRRRNQRDQLLRALPTPPPRQRPRRLPPAPHPRRPLPLDHPPEPHLPTGGHPPLEPTRQAESDSAFRATQENETPPSRPRRPTTLLSGRSHPAAGTTGR